MGIQKSGWHQGKGNRRMPPFKSRGRGKIAEWEKQAAHHVPKVELRPPLSEVVYEFPAGKTPGEAIYLFDQECARHRLTYYVEEISDGTFGFSCPKQ